MGYPLRVLHVVVNMNRGGAETLLMNLYRNIDRTQVQFDFLTCKEGVFDSEIKAMGGTIHRIPYITEVGHVKYKEGLATFFINHPAYKIVHSHMDKMSGLVLQAAKQAGVPIRIAHSHNTRSEGGILARSYKSYIGKNIKQHATHLYACSHAAAKWLFGKQAKHTSVLPNGIEPSKFMYTDTVRSKLRSQLKINRDTLVLGHVGRFSKQKNHSFLLEVFASVQKQKQNSILLLAGDGPLKHEVLAKIEELHLAKHVKLLGVREDIHHLLQAMDIFVFPSLHEGLPLTLVEAQGAGLPCVISNTITNEVDMACGLVHSLPLTNKEKWVRQIIQLTDKKQTRKISMKALAMKGYDIQKTAQVAQKNYLSYGKQIGEKII